MNCLVVSKSLAVANIRVAFLGASPVSVDVVLANSVLVVLVRRELVVLVVSSWGLSGVVDRRT
jgi:hypothetical protein